MKIMKIFGVALVVSALCTACMSGEAEEASPTTDKVETPPDATNTEDTDPAGIDRELTTPDGTKHHSYDSDEDPVGDTLPEQ